MHEPIIALPHLKRKNSWQSQWLLFGATNKHCTEFFSSFVQLPSHRKTANSSKIIVDAGSSQRSKCWSFLLQSQARNQLGTPEGEKSFLKESQIFKLCPIHFSKGAKKFYGAFDPLLPPSYGPGAHAHCFKLNVIYQLSNFGTLKHF